MKDRKGLVTARACILAALILLIIAGALFFPRSGPDAPPPPPDPASAAPQEDVAPLPDRIPVAPGSEILVTDPDGERLAGASVEFVRLSGVSTPSVLGVTGADGILPWRTDPTAFPGFLRASHPDHGSTVLEATALRDRFVLRLGPALSMLGRVTGPDGSPVEGASVTFRYMPQYIDTVLDQDKGSFVLRALTGAEGMFRFGGISVPVTALVTARAAGFAPASRRLRLPVPDRIDLVLGVEMTTRVRLVDTDGRPLENGSVVLGGSPSFLTFPDDAFLAEYGARRLDAVGDGWYETRGLPAGHYALLATHDGHAPHLRQPVLVRAGAEPETVVLAPSSGITGLVTRADSTEPVEGAVVRYIPPGKLFEYLPASRGMVSLLGEEATSTTDASGVFRLPLAGPGDGGTIEISAPGYQLFRWSPLKSLVREGRLLAWMHPVISADIIGRVVSEGRGVSGALLRWKGGATATDTEGSFRVEGLPLPVALIVTAEHHLRRITVISDEPETTLEIELAAARPVETRAIDESGRPVAGVWLQFELLEKVSTPETTIVPASAWTGPDGRARIELPANVPFRVSPVKTERWHGEGTSVADGQSEVELVLLRQPSGSLTGLLLAAEGGSLPAYAMVFAQPASGNAHTVVVNPSGQFELEALPTGTCRLTLSVSPRPGDPVVVLTRRDVEIVDRETTRVEIRYEAPAEKPQEVLLRVRVVGGGDVRDPETLQAFATTADGTCYRLRATGELLQVGVPADEPTSLWVFSRDGKAAAVAERVRPTTEPLEVNMWFAGRVALPVAKSGTSRIVRVHTRAGKLLFERTDSRLPIAGGLRILPLPPGRYRVTLDEMSPQDVEVTAGKTTSLE